MNRLDDLLGSTGYYWYPIWRPLSIATPGNIMIFLNDELEMVVEDRLLNGIGLRAVLRDALNTNGYTVI